MASAHQRDVIEAQQANAMPYITNAWSRRVVQPLLIAILVTSLGTAVIAVIQFVLPNQPLLRIVPFVFLIILEGIYTKQWLMRPNQRALNRTAYRAAELMFIFLASRFYTWAVFGNRPVLELFTEYLKSPGLLLFDPYMVFTFILTLVSWGVGLGFGTLFNDLAIDEGEARYFLLPKNERSDDARPYRLNRTALVNIFFGQWLWGGVIMLMLTAMSTIDLPTAVSNFTLNVSRLGLSPALFWALMGYFISGFLLLSQGRLTAQTARWLRAGAVKETAVERSWYRNSTWLLLLIALITAFLPIGSTTPIGQLLSTILSGVFTFFTALFALFWAFLGSLFPEREGEVVPTPTPEPQATTPALPTAEPPPPVPPNDVAQYIFSSAFWAVAIVVAILALSFFVRERGIKLNMETLRLGWQQLKMMIRLLWGRMHEQAAAIQHALGREPRSKQVEDGRPNPFNFIRVNGLVPREQIKYFYLSTLQRIADKGIERGKGVTPTEFEETLREQFPDNEEEVKLLTDAFLRARYSQQEFEEEEVNPIKRQWKRMRSTIRRKKVN